MSLIRIRLDRKKNWIDNKKGLPPRQLIFLLVILLIVIWYLGVRF